MTRLRLLPWSGPDGKRAYLSTDASGNSFLSRLADDIEAVQLSNGAEVLEHARKILGDQSSTREELRFTALRLTESLSDALRVAESRGARLT